MQEYHGIDPGNKGYYHKKGLSVEQIEQLPISSNTGECVFRWWDARLKFVTEGAEPEETSSTRGNSTIGGLRCCTSLMNCVYKLQTTRMYIELFGLNCFSH
jgi:hypothetical protein